MSAEDREMNEQFARWTKKPIESANADDILLKLKNKKALIIQCFARIYLAKIIVYNAWKDAEFNMNSFHDQYILDRKNSHMAKNARLAARNKFIKQYVTDIIHTCMHLIIYLFINKHLNSNIANIIYLYRYRLLSSKGCEYIITKILAWLSNSMSVSNKGIYLISFNLICN